MALLQLIVALVALVCSACALLIFAALYRLGQRNRSVQEAARRRPRHAPKTRSYAHRNT